MDMVTMTILESTMVAICREMGITLMKTSYSTIFNEGLDFTCAFATARGDMIAVADFCPAQIGGMPLLIQSSVRELAEDSIEEGDVIVHNDPYRGGLHTPEHTFFKPIFLDGELMGYAVSIGHVSEIGGAAPGSFAAEATEIFHEGLRVPPVKIMKRGEDNDEVWKLLLANVRTPRENYGDYRALISAVDLGERRLLEVIRKYGKEVFQRTCDDLLDYSEKRMRAELASFPDGHYHFEDCMEDDGIDNRPYRIAVTAHFQDGEVIIDFTGSDAQARGAINATLGVAWSASFNAILHCTDPTIPKNSGCFRPIKVIAPPGTVVNVDFPAPSVGGNTETHPRIAYTVVGALAQARPDRGFATDAATHCNFLFGGVDSRSGDYYVCYDFLSAGWGGRPFADGNNAVNCINGNCRMVPTEVFEVRYPFLVEEMSLVPDSGGPGLNRGGLGVTKRYLARDRITVSLMSDRHKLSPWGLEGGGSAGRASCYFQRKGHDDWVTAVDDCHKRSTSKFAGVTLENGDRIHLTTGGGGGWGDPHARDPGKVDEDVAEGWVSPAARSAYAG